MLDTDTKRRIDTARDILVGKVPDPKSQVEQITIALIYKFMDDMDAEVVELGGDQKFFAGEFAKFGWAQLMSPTVGGHELIDSYKQGLSKIQENIAIPELFRDILKDADVPYKDPATLKSFLKVIDEFTYDHSERLGDAFEYLLSVLGSQGDAGQFRTPRHIIDFMVEILRPQKGEVILDPACGTAGFLISAYKHILRSNLDAQGNSTLTPDEKGLMATNFRGYDISPDMVRLSLVNLYLHGFKSPQIAEYDTLTSEDKWNEFADVILANPPFMSPKGGIKPHKRFSIQAKRSEVLFVDYMAEHLSPRGRAGIIVPEGIIFQSQTAYKDLRKMLVENSLVAVISLPAGVFNPYSGVKTSILILDKSLAKKTDKIAFFKVENDGFGLGAQRREVSGGQLSQVQVELAEYLQVVRNQESTDNLVFSLGLIVPKEKISANGDYNLSGERYREIGSTSSEYSHVELREICEINPETANPTELYPDSFFNYIDISCVENESGKFLGANKVNTDEAPSRARRLVKQNDVLLSTVRPNLKAFTILSEVPDRAIASTGFAILRSKAEQLLSGFLIVMLRHQNAVDQMIGMMGKGAYPSINQSDVESIKIPLPSIAIQQEIVTEIEGYQKVINGSRAVIDNYRPHIAIDPDWEMVAIENLVADERHSMKAGPFGSSLKKEFYVPSGYKIYGQEQVIRGDAKYGDYYINEEKYRELESCKVKAGDVLISLVGTYGKTLIVPEDYEAGIINPRLIKLTFDREKITPSYFVLIFNQESVMSQVRGLSYGGTMDILSLKVIKSLCIPVPPLETQKSIVAEIEAEQALVNANRELIERFEKKIQTVLNRIWGGE